MVRVTGAEQIPSRATGAADSRGLKGLPGTAKQRLNAPTTGCTPTWVSLGKANC